MAEALILFLRGIFGAAEHGSENGYGWMFYLLIFMAVAAAATPFLMNSARISSTEEYRRSLKRGEAIGSVIGISILLLAALYFIVLGIIKFFRWLF